jgi:hypothetical protein
MADIQDVLEKWKPFGVTEENVVYASDEIVVFLRNNLDTDWITTPDFDSKLEVINKSPEWGFIKRTVTRLQSIPIDHLSLIKREGFRTQLGTALSLGLQEDFANAKESLRTAEDFVTARNNEVARGWFLESSGIAVLLFLVFLLATFHFNCYGAVTGGSDLTTIQKVLFCSAAGAVGAFLSVISRITKIPLDPAAGRYMHYLEGGSRVIAGIIAAPFLLFAVKLGVILPSLDKDGIEAVILIGIVAGASERLIPSLIGNVESQASDSNKSR